MYFFNIANEELQQFHKTIGVDFSLTLSEILESDLFHVEDMGNNIYRVIPLFYCKKVISNNAIDKVDNVNCLILVRNLEHETYLSFMTNSGKSTVLFNPNLLDIKSIEDNLTTGEFNALVYRLRKLGVITGNLNYEEITSITGEYGEYVFSNFSEQLKNDAGIIINEKIKKDPITVELKNPFFLNAKYTLTFTVLSLTGANVCEEESEDFKVKTTFSVDLKKDTPIPINLSSYTNDSVLLFDTQIDISFDVPEIVNRNFNLTLTSDNDRIALGESITLTATLSGEANVGGYVVNFYEDGTLLDPLSTDENGVAELEYTPISTNTHNYSCTVLGLSSEVNVVVYNRNTKLTIETTSRSIRVDNNITLTGTLLDVEDTPLENMSVKLYENNILIDDDLTTDSNGVFTKTITHNIVNNYNYRAEYTGSEGYLGVISNLVNVEVYKYSSSISFDTSASTVYYKPNGGCNFVVSGVLNKEGEAFSGQIVKLYNGNTLIDNNLRTQSDGSFTKTIYPANTGSYTLKAVYEGTDKIQSVTSTVKTVVVRKIKTSLTAIPSKSTVNLGESITISGRLTDEFGNGIPNCLIRVSGTELGGYTNNNGEYSFSYNEASKTLGSKTISVSFQGYTRNGYIGYSYDKADSDRITINCIRFTTDVNILDSEEYYIVGDEILIEVTSNDANFNPNSINVTFNGKTSKITTKNNEGKFIFTIPQINQRQGNYNITASYNQDNTHDEGITTKTITVYNTLQSFTLETSGSKGIKITAKNQRGVVLPNLIIPTLSIILTGFPGVPEIDISDATFNANGQWVWNDLGDYLHGQGTIQASYNEIESNILNVTF